MARAGFTLLEMLVVLAVLAMAATALAFGLKTGADDRRLLETTASDIASAMRYVRLEAMLTNRERVFALDMGKRVYGLEPATQPVDARIALVMTTVREKQMRENVGRIQFTPTGQSSGATITLKLDDDTVAVKADWLTGRVAVEVAK
jgi:general secretion pathway protein H